jgi:hypothetical protein
VGRPLPWNVFDASGVLLLRRGFIIDTQHALDRLIDEGMFVDEKAGRDAADAEPPVDTPSALRFLVDARKLMELPGHNPASVRDFPARMMHAIQLVENACNSAPNVAIASILLLQDESYTQRHAIDTAIVCHLIARAMAMSPEQMHSAMAAAITMNIGMYEVQDKLNEIKGPLNEKLRQLITSHPALGKQQLVKLGVDDPYWLKCVEQHHECENGAGYPNHLAGKDIEVGAKVVALADRYCAQISRRGYRPMRPPGVALKDLYIEHGAEIDPLVAAYLVRVVGLYPPGTIVRLHSGEIAVVVEPTEHADAPVAYAVLGPSGAALAIPVKRRTNRDGFKIIDVLTLDRVDFPIQMSRLWGDSARLN